MTLARQLHGTTVFLGCGFAAKYLHGGGNFSVPLQWMLGLQRLGLDAIWLEWMPATTDDRSDARHIRAFEQHLRDHGLGNRYVLLCQKGVQDVHDLDTVEYHGLTSRQLEDRLAGPTILLNLSHSIHPPLIHRFNRRIYCDLDPGEISYWMVRMEMGQSYHHEFWSVGLNKNGADCQLPKTPVAWKTFFPLVDTELYQPAPQPPCPRFTTIGQWYFQQGLEVNGEYPDLSKKTMFEPYMTMPRLVPEARMELAMNLNADDPEIARIHNHGWKLVVPHDVAGTPSKYRSYIAGSLAEFTTTKGVDRIWRTGWLSDRAAAYLATGRPVITEDTGAQQYLPSEHGFLWFSHLEEAAENIRRVMRDWQRLSRQARACAVEIFDSARNLKKILGE